MKCRYLFVHIRFYLQAYSILDPELGYCQGLGFICGVLLLHVSI